MKGKDLQQLDYLQQALGRCSHVQCRCTADTSTPKSYRRDATKAAEQLISPARAPASFWKASVIPW